MIDNKKMAQWMLSQFKKGWLYQEDVAYELEKNHGMDYVYENERNGNLAISKPLLREFRKLTEGTVVWDRYEKAWRQLEEGEKYEGRSEY
ncbi:DUF6953 family protein [Pseudoalteromonas sp. GB43]